MHERLQKTLSTIHYYKKTENTAESTRREDNNGYHWDSDSPRAVNHVDVEDNNL